MDFRMVKQLRDQPALRQSFMALASETFGLDFSPWHQAGYWTDRYIPYSLAEGDRVVSNVSVNVIDTRFRGRPRRYIQLGTVMTDPAYRRRGLARRLMEAVLADWRDGCDGIYLYSNDGALGFYAQFGFHQATEHQYALTVAPKPAPIRQLDMSAPGDRAVLERCYRLSNPFSALPMLDNYGLLMFYCTSVLKDCVFYCQEADGVVIAARDPHCPVCYDVFSNGNAPLHQLLSPVFREGTGVVLLGFTPKDASGCTLSPLSEEDTTLLVYGEKENLFAANKLMLPLLSRA